MVSGCESGISSFTARLFSREQESVNLSYGHSSGFSVDIPRKEPEAGLETAGMTMGRNHILGVTPAESAALPDPAAGFPGRAGSTALHGLESTALGPCSGRAWRNRWTVPMAALRFSRASSRFRMRSARGEAAAPSQWGQWRRGWA